MSRIAMRCAWMVVVAGTLAKGGAARSQDSEVDLRIPPISGEPGQEVALEFRATVRNPILAAVIRFESLDAAASFLRASAEGTAASHFEPRGIGHNPHSANGGSEVFLRGNTRQPNDEIATGTDVVLVKAILRIRADAPLGEYAVRILSVDFSGVAPIHTMKVLVEGESRLTVVSSSRPRPAGSLRCDQDGRDVSLTWTNTGAYDSLEVSRNGEHLATLPGDATSFRHAPPLGPAEYSVVANRAGDASLAATCGLLVETPRPAPVSGLACEPLQDGVRLAWSNGAPYDSLRVFRNEREVATLPAESTAYFDAWTSTLFTIYTVRGALNGIESAPTSCRVNEQSGDYVVWAEDVRAEPGSTAIAVRVFCTNPQPLQGAQIAFRIDPAHVRIRELTLDGTASEAAGYDQFLYQRHVLDQGETACGIYYDSTPPYGILFPAGADQHLLTVVVDIAADAPSGASVELRFNNAGSPKLNNDLSVNGMAHAPDSRSGSILIGASPVPEVGDPEAHVGGGGGDGAGGAASGIALRWSNRGAYSEIRVERDGQPLATLQGGATSFDDGNPGPGVHRYRIFAIAGGVASFPTIVTSRPTGVPGTFLRGDATRDSRVNISDAAGVLLYLFQGGGEPPCLDAADADDNGRIDLADALTLLHYLFRGSLPLPEPGTSNAWFDPTPDELGCD